MSWLVHSEALAIIIKQIYHFDDSPPKRNLDIHRNTCENNAICIVRKFKFVYNVFAQVCLKYICIFPPRSAFLSRPGRLGLLMKYRVKLGFFEVINSSAT